jgi:hypothetical protein
MQTVEWTLIDPTLEAPISRGDRVSAEAGGLPIYEVLQIADGRAWLREERRGQDYLLPTARLRWKLQSGPR